MSHESLILCPKCGVKLRLRPDFQGKERRCPRCQYSFPAQPADAMPGTPAQATDQPERQRGSAEGQASVEKKRRRIKKRKRVAKARAPGAWVWWWGSLTLAVALVGVGIVSMYQNGYPKFAVAIAARLTVGLPIGAVIFAVSMFISNYFGVDIELANFGTLIPKALWIVLVANLVALISCFGGLAALAVFYIGAIALFKLDVWEARFLVLINWGLNWVAWVFVVTAIVSVVTKAQ